MAFAKTFKLGTIFPEDQPDSRGAVLFKQLVEEATGGDIKINVFPNSQLGGPKEMFSQMQLGALEMGYWGINTLAWIKGGEPFEITAIPFLYKSYAAMRCVLTSGTFEPIMAATEKTTGIKVVNIHGDTPPRGLTTGNRPVWSAADFKGLKIRTAASPTVIAAMEKLGALPQQIPFSDLYLALRTGVVDAQENGSITVKNTSLFEVQGYYMKTDYIRDIATFYVAMPVWNGLSERERKIIREASEKAGDFVTSQVRREIDASVSFLSTRMKVIIPNTESIRNALDGVFEPLFEGKKWPKGLLAKVRELQEGSCNL
jgi:tripartite ATP-independent transporter DctP family solute receptor